MTLQQPRLVVGRGGGVPAMLTVGIGYQDDSVNYDLLASTDRLAPAGVGGECAFYTLYVAVEHDVAIPVLRVTPIVDGVALPATDYNIAVPTARHITILEVPVLERFPSTVAGFATLGRFAKRGAWIEVKVETVGGNTGYVALHGCEVEHEVMREALNEGANK